MRPLPRPLALCLFVLATAACSSRLNAPDRKPPDGDGGTFVGGGGANHVAFGLTSLLPGPDFLRASWRATQVEPGQAEVGLFMDLDQSLLFSGTPLFTSDGAGAFTIEGLADATRYFVGLAVREGADDWTPTGSVLFARTGAPVYVDPAADGVGADGTTPGTAYNDIFLAVVTAFSNGGGNVWAAEGDFREVSFPLLEGVDMYGGFASGFVVEERDPDATPTRFLPLGGQFLVRIDAGQKAQIVDGFALDGLDATSNGIDVSDTDVQFRSLSIRGCGRGIRLRNGSLIDVVEISITHGSFVENSVEGVSVVGAFDLTIEDSRFEGNAAEGLDGGPLTALDGLTSTVRVRDCLFLGNGADGLDIDLGVPAGGGTTGGHFDVLLEDCDFISNGFTATPAGTGAQLDVDYELTPGWNSSLVVRGCKTRGNASDGLLLDLDADAPTLVQRLVSSGNRGHGISVTSETASGTAIVSASVLAANLGAGVNSEAGNVGVVLSHCVLTGNFGGGLRSAPAPAAAISSVAFLQPLPWSASQAHASVVIDAPSPLPFLFAPNEFVAVTGQVDAELTLAAQPNFGVGTIVELDDDEVLRTAASVGTLSVTVEPAPGVGPPAAVLMAQPGTDSVTEDWRLDEASVAVGAGMSAPGADPVDAGVFGTPLAGDPGSEELVPAPLFYLEMSEPSWSLPVPPAATIELSFSGGVPAAASLMTGVFVVDSLGQPVPVTPFVDAGRILIPPPSGGWSSGDWIELHPALSSTQGVGLAAPLALPLLTP